MSNPTNPSDSINDDINEILAVVIAQGISAYKLMESKNCDDRIYTYTTEYREEAKQKLLKLKAKWQAEAQLGMIDYYDQVTNNKDMDWKGLFADNRKQIEYELEQLRKDKPNE